VLGVACYLVARPAPKPAAAPDLSGWKLADLLTRLREKGVRFEAVVDHRERDLLTRWVEGAWLTRTGKGRSELGLLTRLSPPERWRGTVRVTWHGPGFDETPEELRLYGERLAVAGPFIFFGDPEMIREVERALAE
jgi:hypothetical protein